MDVRAAVARKAGEPLVVETVQLDGPKAGEALVEIRATGICHTDEFTRSGADPEGLFPAILGHEGAGIVVEVGPGVTSLFALGGRPVFHYMGTSTFANYTVVPEIALAKIRPDAPFDKVCYIGCGVTTGLGAVLFTAKVEAGSTVVVFGLGGIGLNVIQGARMVGAGRIVGVDVNPARELLARKFGLPDFVNPL